MRSNYTMLDSLACLQQPSLSTINCENDRIVYHRLLLGRDLNGLYTPRVAPFCVEFTGHLGPQDQYWPARAKAAVADLRETGLNHAMSGD